MTTADVSSDPEYVAVVENGPYLRSVTADRFPLRLQWFWDPQSGNLELTGYSEYTGSRAFGPIIIPMGDAHLMLFALTDICETVQYDRGNVSP